MKNLKMPKEHSYILNKWREELEKEANGDIYEYALGVLNKLDFGGLSLQEKIDLLAQELAE